MFISWHVSGGLFVVILNQYKVKFIKKQFYKIKDSLCPIKTGVERHKFSCGGDFLEKQKKIWMNFS